MNFNLKKPCKDCPFLKSKERFLCDSRYKEIAEDLVNDKSFSCHKTNDFDSEGMAIETTKTEHCAGALIMLEKMDNPNQFMNIGRFFGLYDPSNLDMNSDVYDSFNEMARCDVESTESQSEYRKRERSKINMI